MSSNTKYKKKKTKETCPLSEGEPASTHNDVTWYTRDYTPFIGANYSRLTTINGDAHVFSGFNVALDTLVQHRVLVTPPIDASNSAMAKIAELYTEIREMNSGATNYTVDELAAYIYNIQQLRMLYWTVCRGLSAMRYGNALYRESPSMFLNLVGFDSYMTESQSYAYNFNRLALYAKDIEALPVPPLALLDRTEFYMSSVFADSQTTRPALIAFVPSYYYQFDVDSNGKIHKNNYNPVATSINTALLGIDALYRFIINNNANTIIRGDLLKAFGNEALRHNLLPSLSKPLRLGYNEDVACQLENATLLEAGASAVPDYNPATPNITVSGSTNGYNAINASVVGRVINYHGVKAPTDGELLAITRLATDGVFANSKIEVQSSSGITILGTQFLTASGTNSAPTWLTLGSILSDVTSTIQSTAVAAYQKLCNVPKLVDRFPMIIYDLSAYGWSMDIDNFAIIDRSTIMDYTELANRSLMVSHLPRTPTGRIDKVGRTR